MLAYIKIEIDNKIDELNLQEYEKEQYKKEVVQEYLDEYGLSEYEEKLDEMLQSQAECYQRQLNEIDEIAIELKNKFMKMVGGRINKVELVHLIETALNDIHEIASDY